MFTIDLGSGNTCQNDIIKVRDMLFAVEEIDKDKKIILKWQLFKEATPNIPLKQDVFDYAYNYAKDKGFQTTASVFDIDSLKFLLNYDVPFIKIANRKDLYRLIGNIPRKIKVVQSVSKINETGFEDNEHHYGGVYTMCCVSKYPATTQEYLNIFKTNLYFGVSDHTTDWELYKQFQPEWYECHFCLEHNDKNPDAGLFSRTPEQLKEIIGFVK